MSKKSSKSWEDALVNVIGREPPLDSMELRTSFIENVMLDKDGNPITQHQLHNELQGFMFRVEQEANKRGEGGKGLIRAPYASGKSQQVAVALPTYITTRKPETENLIISADKDIATKRIISIRQLVESSEYKYWCKDHNFKPLQYDRKLDTGSTEKVTFKSKNRTGNPSIEANAVLSRTAGQRCQYLWLDDICNDEDRISKARRKQVWSKITNTWIKRVHDKGFVFDVCTPYHYFDCNSRLMRSGIFDVLQIAINESKDGYILKEWSKSDAPDEQHKKAKE